MAWAYFLVIQVVCLISDFIGLIFVLPLPCAFHFWVPAMSTEWNADAPIKAHSIMVWRWNWLNAVWGNPEDGVLGPDWHLPGRSAWWRAYAWSALRNRSDALKYVFRWVGGPFKRWEFGSWYVQCGWNSSGLPTISAGSS
jgi:hypothetical protein